MSVIGKNNKIKVQVFYIEKKLKSGNIKLQVLSNEKAKELLSNEKESVNIKTINSWWKKLSWKETNEILSLCRIPAKDARLEDGFDYYKFRDLKFKKCLVEWDLKDEGNKPIPTSPSIIDELDVQIANALYSEYEASMEEDEEEEKK